MPEPAPEVERPTYEIVGPIERYDQRDHAIAREQLVPGSSQYEEYYSRHPEHKEWDDGNRQILTDTIERLREIDPVNQQLYRSAAYGRYVLGLRSIVEGTDELPPALSGLPSRVDVDPMEMAKKIKAYGLHLGAAKVRITKLKREWVVTNGAPEYRRELFGEPVELNYENVICMAFPQDPRMIKCGIGIANRLEAARKYAYSSLVSTIIAHFIRCTGWQARALPPSNSPYLVVPTFIDAGIGEQGRCGFVVTKEFGNNFRPGAVATDMPLALDKPVDFGIQDFCDKCLLCAEHCPSGAIPSGVKEVVRGVRRWAIDADKCRRYWNKLGGSCSICQAVCPWNHSNNLVHDTIRQLAQNLPWLRRFLIRSETLVYGKYKAAPQPDWITSKGIRTLKT